MKAAWILLPDFAVIALGYLLARRLNENTWRQLDWLSFHVLYPALLFGAASQRPISLSVFLSLGAMAAAVVTLGLAMALAVRRLGPASSVDSAGALQNGWRFNTALGFVAVKALPAEATAVLAIIVGVAIPLANLYAVLLLTRGQQLSPVRVLKELALNPFLLASLSGAMVALSGWSQPAVWVAFVDRLANAALPIVLLSIGAALRGSHWWPPARFALALHAVKLLALPAIVLAGVVLSRQAGVTAATLLIFAALPTATAAHVLASRYGGDRQPVAVIVTQSALLGLLTLPLWTAVAVWISGA